MEQLSVETGNKLIAEFMNFREYLDNPKFRYSDLVTYHKYHSSWDWLMPVVEKIENGLKWKYEVIAANNLYAIGKEWYCIIRDSGNATYLELASKKSKIDACWQAVIEFIKFYKP